MIVTTFPKSKSLEKKTDSQFEKLQPKGQTRLKKQERNKNRLKRDPI